MAEIKHHVYIALRLNNHFALDNIIIPVICESGDTTVLVWLKNSGNIYFLFLLVMPIYSY